MADFPLQTQSDVSDSISESFHKLKKYRSHVKMEDMIYDPVSYYRILYFVCTGREFYSIDVLRGDMQMLYSA